MTVTPITFYSEGFKLVGDLYTPDDLRPSERRAGIVLCHGYTGVKDLYLPDNARVLVEAGYVVLAFDYKGWGESEGPPTRLAPYSRVADVQAALTFLGAQDAVDEVRLGIYGTSYGGATVVWTGAVDGRVRCIVSVVGIGHGERWMRGVRRPDEWFDLLERSAKDRVKRTMDGESEFIDRNRDPAAGPTVGGARGGGTPQRPVRARHAPAGIRRRDPGLSSGVGGGQRSRRAPSCSSPPTTTGSCLRKNLGCCTRKPANRRSWWCSKATGTTRCTRNRPSAR